MLRAGIIGLPNVGKTTLFNALTLRRAQGKRASVANYPFTTVEPNVGVVPIPDDRLEAVARAARSKKITPAAIELVDIAGLVKGAHTGAGLGNEFLSHIRAVDALLHVVRAFEDPDVARAGSTTSAEDIETVQGELRAKDTELRERRKEKKRADAEPIRDLAVMPALYVFNLGERMTELPTEASRFQPSAKLSAKIEAELAELPDPERATFLKEYGLTHARTIDVVHALIELLHLVTFYTANENEARSWLVPRGTPVVEAAGLVHTDFARGFIRAEVVSAADLVAAGSLAAARAGGHVRDEGREYAVQDGDVLRFATAPGSSVPA